MDYFLITSTGRTGSTLLSHLLNSHPSIFCDGELVHPHRWQTRRRRPFYWFVSHYPQPFLKLVAKKRHRQAEFSLFGMKLMYRHMANPRHTLASLSRSGWKIVHSKRRSRFDQALSWTMALHTHRWFATMKERLPLPVTLPTQSFHDNLVKLKVENAQLEMSLADIPHMDIVYEDCLQSADQRQMLSEAICDFLEINDASLQTDFSRTWQQPYAQAIENYSELIAIYNEFQTDQVKASEGSVSS